MFTKIDLCLLCLTNNSKLKSILSKDSDGVIIDEKLKIFISKQIKIEPEDSMLYICLSCLKKLKNVYNYKRLCLRNISRFSSFIHKLKSTDEPCSNLRITLIDIQNINIDKVTCENEINNDTIITENCMVDNPNDETKHEQKPEDIGEILANEIECTNISDNFNKAKEEDFIIEEMPTITILNDEVKYECGNKIVAEVSEENISGNAENKQPQEENVIKEEVLDENYIKFEFVDSVVKEEPEDNYDTIDIMSDLQNDALLNETDNNEESTSKSDSRNNECHKSLKCDVCDKEFNHPSGLNRHKIIHSGIRPYKCTICEKTFNQKYHLETHTRLHTGEQLLKCNVCEELFNTSSILLKHISNYHNKEISHKCDVCDKPFNNQCDLDTHKLIHSGMKPYKCGICDKAFNMRSTLIRHIKRCHYRRRSHKCDICDKVFFDQSDLGRHKLTHSDVKPHKCDICEKAFHQSSKLVEHKRSHSGEKPCKCDICDKAFYHQSSLVKHKLTHSGTTYKCDICEKTFKWKASLRAHIRWHTGEKPFKCDVCDEAFNYRSVLVAHKHLHTGERPFKCDVCDQTFNYQSHLATHKRIHSGTKPYKCDVCNKAFIRRDQLRAHISRIHRPKNGEIR